MYRLYNIDSAKYEGLDVPESHHPYHKFDAVYADMIYENMDFTWTIRCMRLLREGGVLIIQTDHHSVLEVGNYVKNFVYGSEFINHLVWKCEWGNHPKDRFHQCFDDILIFRNGKTPHKFYSDRIQVDKVTKNKGLNPSGRDTKTATAFISDITLTTTSNERIKKDDGHLVRWQKPESLMQRILEPFTDVGDWIYEPFGGTFSACRWAVKNGRNAVGVELDKEIYELGKKALEDINDVPVQMQKMLF